MNASRPTESPGSAASHCYRAFDPTTDDDQFRKRLPHLPGHATDNQRRIAEQYTRISFCLSPDEDEPLGYKPDATHVWLVVGGQQFCVTGTPQCNRHDAAFMCWMLSKAIERIVTAEKIEAIVKDSESSARVTYTIRPRYCGKQATGFWGTLAEVHAKIEQDARDFEKAGYAVDRISPGSVRASKGDERFNIEVLS